MKAGIKASVVLIFVTLIFGCGLISKEKEQEEMPDWELMKNEFEIQNRKRIIDTNWTNDSGIFPDLHTNIKYSWIRIGNYIWMAEDYLGKKDSPHWWISDIRTREDQIIVGNSYRSGELDSSKNCPDGWTLPSFEAYRTIETLAAVDLGYSNYYREYLIADRDTFGIGLSFCQYDSLFHTDRNGSECKNTYKFNAIYQIPRGRTSCFWTSSIAFDYYKIFTVLPTGKFDYGYDMYGDFDCRIRCVKSSSY